MMTASRRKNLIKALRKSMLLSTAQAIEVIDANWLQLTCTDKPFHDIEIVPIQHVVHDDWSGLASVWIAGEYDSTLRIPAGLMRPVQTASLAAAYGLSKEDVARYESEIHDMMNWNARVNRLAA